MMRDLSSYRHELRQNAIVHDQDLFASQEVMFSGKQTYAPSRLALLLSLVERGEIDWDPSVVEATYASLAMGVQHAFSVYRTPDSGWPDERGYIAAARRAIVDAGCEPDYVRAVRDRYREGGNPFGEACEISNDAARVMLFVDPVETHFASHSVETSLRLLAHVAPDVRIFSGRSAAYELFSLGYWREAEEALAGIAEDLRDFGCEVLIMNSPEAWYSLTAFADDLHIDFPCEIVYLDTFLERQVGEGAEPSSANAMRVAVHDSPLLVRRDNGSLVRALLGRHAEVVPMMYERDEVIPAGALPGNPLFGLRGSMARRRLDETRVSGPDVLVTLSPYDLDSLRSVVQEHDPDVMLWTEFLVEQWGI